MNDLPGRSWWRGVALALGLMLASGSGMVRAGELVDPDVVAGNGAEPEDGDDEPVEPTEPLRVPAVAAPVMPTISAPRWTESPVTVATAPVGGGLAVPALRPPMPTVGGWSMPAGPVPEMPPSLSVPATASRKAAVSLFMPVMATDNAPALRPVAAPTATVAPKTLAAAAVTGGAEALRPAELPTAEIVARTAPTAELPVIIVATAPVPPPVAGRRELLREVLRLDDAVSARELAMPDVAGPAVAAMVAIPFRRSPEIPAQLPRFSALPRLDTGRYTLTPVESSPFFPSTAESVDSDWLVPFSRLGPVPAMELSTGVLAAVPVTGSSWSLAALSGQSAMGRSLLERRMDRQFSANRITPADAEKALAICAERMREAAAPADRERWIERAWPYWRRARGGTGQTEAFGAWFAEVLGGRLSPPRKTYLLARLANDAGRYDECVGLLGRLDDDPDADGFRDEILLLRSVSDLQREIPGAVAGLEQLLERYPDSPLRPRALFLLAWNDLMEGRDEESRKRLEQFLDRHPDDPMAKRARELLTGLRPKAIPPKATKKTPAPALPADEVF